MNRPNLLVLLVATIGTALALASGAALAAKPIKPSTGDPCSDVNLDFPAFAYWSRLGNTPAQLRVADSTGTCSRIFGETSGAPLRLAFSYPVAGTTDVGRVVYVHGSTLYRVDFSVVGTNIAVSQAQIVYEYAACCALDLSADGLTVYFSTSPEILSRLALVGTASPVAIRQLGTGEHFSSVSVNRDESVMFTDENFDSGSPGNRLVRVDLSGIESPVILDSRIPRSQYWQSVNPEEDRLVYTYYLPGSNNCYLLQVIPGTGGPILNSGQPRFGTHSTWLDGSILTRGHRPPDRKGACAFTGVIYRVNPDTSSENAVIAGNDPDGR